MEFSTEPTAQADDIASYVRAWYEAHRETWWQRLRRREECADDFMLGLIEEVRRVTEAAGRARSTVVARKPIARHQ
jgi:hypothetical protein